MEGYQNCFNLNTLKSAVFQENERIICSDYHDLNNFAETKTQTKLLF